MTISRSYHYNNFEKIDASRSAQFDCHEFSPSYIADPLTNLIIFLRALIRLAAPHCMQLLTAPMCISKLSVETYSIFFYSQSLLHLSRIFNRWRTSQCIICWRGQWETWSFLGSIALLQNSFARSTSTCSRKNTLLVCCQCHDTLEIEH